MTKETSDKPQPPKRPLSAFFLYRQERYKDVTAANPAKGVAVVTKIISEEWNKLPEEKKKKYQDSYQTAKVKYDQEIKEYINKYGKVEKKKKIKREKKAKAGKGAKKGDSGKQQKTNPAVEHKEA